MLAKLHTRGAGERLTLREGKEKKNTALLHNHQQALAVVSGPVLLHLEEAKTRMGALIIAPKMEITWPLGVSACEQSSIVSSVIRRRNTRDWRDLSPSAAIPAFGAFRGP